MVFQGFSFFAMAIVSVGALAYHFYKNREAYFYESPHPFNIYSYHSELQPKETKSEGKGVRKRNLTKVETCSICMESVTTNALNLPKEAPNSAVSLPCEHMFHVQCVKAWLGINKTCPNCRALATAAV